MIVLSGSSLLSSSGTWRELYRNIFFATTLYIFSSEAIHAALARGTYKTGEIYDLPFLGATLGFLWVAISGRRCLRDIQLMPSNTRGSRPAAPRLGKLAFPSLPAVGDWALFLSNQH